MFYVLSSVLALGTILLALGSLLTFRMGVVAMNEDFKALSCFAYVLSLFGSASTVACVIGFIDSVHVS